VVDVTGGGKEDDVTLVSLRSERCERLLGRHRGELGSVTSAEFVELVWIVRVPFAQPGAGGDVFEPLAEWRIALGDATGP
jgi:hypothetical protein